MQRINKIIIQLGSEKLSHFGPDPWLKYVLIEVKKNSNTQKQTERDSFTSSN